MEDEDAPVVTPQTSEQLLNDIRALLDILNLNVPDEAGPLITSMSERIDKHLAVLKARREERAISEEKQSEAMEKMRALLQQDLVSKQTVAEKWATQGTISRAEAEASNMQPPSNEDDARIEALAEALNEAGVDPEELTEDPLEDNTAKKGIRSLGDIRRALGRLIT